MNKVQELIQHLYIEHNRKSQSEKLPPLAVPHIDFTDKESFFLSYQKGEMHIEAKGSMGAIYGITQASIASQTPYLTDYTGDRHPRFPLRPLWLCGTSLCLHTPEIGIHLPHFLTAMPAIYFQNLCCQILEYGFNAIILGSYEGEKWNPASLSISLSQLCQNFRDFGLKVILCPSLHFIDAKEDSFTCCPFNSEYRQALTSLLKQLQTIPYDGLLWKTGCHHPQFTQHPLADVATLVEIIKEELSLLEQSLAPQQCLIYYLSCAHLEMARQQAKWFPFLCDQAGAKTYLSFSMVVGKAYSDHLALHPIWEDLRCLPDISSTPLLPILNGGAIQQGEGMWPTLSLDLIDKFMQRCYRHPFAGAIGLTNRFPTRQGLLSCNLWVLGQTLWHWRSPWLLAEIWFAAYRADLAYGSFQSSLKMLRELTIELNALRFCTIESNHSYFSDYYRIKAESLLQQLQFLQITFQQEKKIGSSPSFIDYFTYFYRDARRIILHTLQQFNLSVSSILTGQDWQSSFWTEALQNSNQGIRNGIKVNFPTQPLRNEKDKIMELIYQENTFYLT